MKKILVIGYGISGRAAAAFLRSRGREVVAVDRKAMEGALLDRDDFPLDEFGQVILSPGVPQSHPIVRRAVAAGIEVIGEIELAFRYIRNRCVGITGSNGKTTTVLLIAHCLRAAGKRARALGNVGESLCGYLLEADPEEILVVELSSFQLETLGTRCLEMAGILNITPNHLDRHASMEEYARAKLRIADCLKEGGELWVSREVRDEWGVGQVFEEIVAPIDAARYIKLGIKKNVQAAIPFCTHFGVSKEEFWEGLETFRKPPHRIEWVADIEGVSYYNDSKSSNIHSVMHAIDLMDGPIVLLVGGIHKGASYTPWIPCFQGKVKKIIAYGEAAGKMEQELASAFHFQRVKTLQEAVSCAKMDAKEKEAVLLSPGCSSYDQFRNFEHRGEEFKRMVKEL